MWDTLTYADIQQAKEQVRAAREEVLQRQAAELEALTAEETELETLHRLIAEFAHKFGQPAITAAAATALPETQDASPPAEPAVAETVPTAIETAPVEAAPGPPPAPAPHNHAPPHRHTKPRHVEEREYGHTNFDSFNRALAKSL